MAEIIDSSDVMEIKKIMSQKFELSDEDNGF
jgi:hypothetical protein